MARARATSVRDIEGLTNQQATQDIQALTRAGLSTPIGNTKAHYYVAGPDFPRGVLDTADRRHIISDPYQQ
ncbi:hypothetical protein ACFVTC_15635 [Streptomyces sp. NPDC057950]|uniref:hypothetical protein n=1 Tax=Streptomyces sp. NPDC057950 TaxID=3346288 RepID=UPI0036E7D762